MIRFLDTKSIEKMLLNMYIPSTGKDDTAGEKLKRKLGIGKDA